MPYRFCKWVCSQSLEKFSIRFLDIWDRFQHFLFSPLTVSRNDLCNFEHTCTYEGHKDHWEKWLENLLKEILKISSEDLETWDFAWLCLHVDVCVTHGEDHYHLTGWWIVCERQTIAWEKNSSDHERKSSLGSFRTHSFDRTNMDWRLSVRWKQMTASPMASTMIVWRSTSTLDCRYGVGFRV